MVLGIDIGSTFTKCVVVKPGKKILKHQKIKTPADQTRFFPPFIEQIKKKYPIKKVVATGYGKGNIQAELTFTDLASLTEGVTELVQETQTIIDIGGQDTKVLHLNNGKICDFVLNERCAAGAGMYIKMALDLLEIDFTELNELLEGFNQVKPMTTQCAVFAQMEIVGRISKGEKKNTVITAAVDVVLNQVKQMAMTRIPKEPILFTGGLSTCESIRERLSTLLEKEVRVPEYAEFLGAYGAAIKAQGVNDANL
jgi:predicted CoA-substrate-specific enzyme activase